MNCDRRTFMLVSAGALATSVLARANSLDPAGLSGRLWNSLKWEMIEGGVSIQEKFQLCREAGFDGVEIVGPSVLSQEEVVAASSETGIPVHGLMYVNHWNYRLSSADPVIREKGRESLKLAIREAHLAGADSVLLVPGHVNGEGETAEHIWQRSIPEIKAVIPTASHFGVRILIENVWNGFCETPTLLRDYIDAFDSPWVGSYFDIGNARKFAPSEDWISTLGNRIVKLDIKDWSAAKGLCDIGSGEVNWPAVRRALSTIGFAGWCTAEVKGGDLRRIRQVRENMIQALFA